MRQYPIVIRCGIEELVPHSCLLPLLAREGVGIDTLSCCNNVTHSVRDLQISMLALLMIASARAKLTKKEVCLNALTASDSQSTL